MLNPAVWSSLALSRLLLVRLVATFAATGPIVMGLDDTIERRRGAQIEAKGIYRDPVRSSHSHLVALSNRMGADYMQEALEAGVFRCVSKMACAQEIVDAIRAAKARSALAKV